MADFISDVGGVLYAIGVTVSVVAVVAAGVVAIVCVGAGAVVAMRKLLR